MAKLDGHRRRVRIDVCHGQFVGESFSGRSCTGDSLARRSGERGLGVARRIAFPRCRCCVAANAHRLVETRTGGDYGVDEDGDRAESAVALFWVNGARIIAYDTPIWRMENRAVSEGVAAHIRREHAAQAIELLQEGSAWHAGNPYWWIERANIALNAGGNLEAAAADYRRAAELPGAPYFAARIHAELLLRMGRSTEAHAWLRHVYSSLPPSDPSAQAARVLQRIRTLERQFELPVTEYYPLADPNVSPPSVSN